MKYILLIMLGILILPIVSAGLTFEQNQNLDFKVACSIDGARCSSSATCNINIRNPDEVYIKNYTSMTNLNNGEFNVSIAGGDLSTLGDYSFCTFCADGVNNGSVCSSFEVTPSGSILSTGEGIIYIIFICVLIFTFLLLLYGSIKIKFGNHRAADGTIISINDLKYLKVVCMVFSYLILMAIFGIMRQITANYLYLNGASKTFQWLFWFMLSFTWPIIVFSVIMMLVMFLTGKKLNKALMRGVPIR